MTTTTAKDLKRADRFVETVQDRATSRGDLVGSMGVRVADEYREHFQELDGRRANKLGGRRQNFWLDIANTTELEDANDRDAMIAVRDERYAARVEGATIRPKRARALTIPVHPLAYGLSVREFESTRGIDLFKPGRRDGNPEGSLAGMVGGEMQVFYALKLKADIPADPEAEPEANQIQAALDDELDHYFDEEQIAREARGRN